MQNEANNHKFRYLVYLHLCILLFSMTEVAGKFAAIEFKAHGPRSIKVYIFIFIMLFICVLYAFCWQKIIKHFDLHIAYANRAMYLVWSQVWAASIFSEHLTPRNILGMFIVMAGVILVSTGDNETGAGSEESEVA